MGRGLRGLRRLFQSDTGGGPTTHTDWLIKRDSDTPFSVPLVLEATITSQEIGFEYPNHGRFRKMHGRRGLRLV